MMLVYILASLYVFFVLYLASMRLWRAHLAGTLPLVCKLLGYPLLGIGWIIDVLMNWTVFSVFFLKPPRGLLVTSPQVLTNFKQAHVYLWFQDITGRAGDKLYA